MPPDLDYIIPLRMGELPPHWQEALAEAVLPMSMLVFQELVELVKKRRAEEVTRPTCWDWLNEEDPF